ncbi:hypothetical protein [Thermotoga sp. SG1]|uniref:hypothetical protein n=1 Tax=Thermotoga sp. SG1 TaxID=126739 RepID=UPI0011AF5BE2|nr:hypothetical protein [Thermotoga sp. SG1]
MKEYLGDPEKRKANIYSLIEVLIIYLLVYFITLFVKHQYIEQLYIVPLIILITRYQFFAQILNVFMYSLFVFFISKRIYHFEEMFLQFCIIFSALVSSLSYWSHVVKMYFLEESLKRSKVNLESFRKYIEYLEDVVDKLKTKLIYENEGISALMLELSKIPAENLKEFAYNFLEKVSAFLEIKKSSFYLYRNGFLRIIASIGNPSFGFSISEDQSLVVKKALEEGSCSILEVFNQFSQLEKEPILAVRIGDEKEILGVVIVEELEDPVQLSNIEKNLKALSVWFIAKLERIEKDAEKHRLPDGTYTVDFYNKIKRRLMDFFAKYSLPFSEICISIYDHELDKVLKAIRSEDLATKIKIYNNRIFLKILLPFCDEVGQISVLERLKHVSRTIEFSNC